MTPRNVFITGGTGYVGRALIPRLLERSHEARALVRRGSEQKLPRGCEAVIGNALDASRVMKAYQAARAEGEKMIRESGLAATILRPWYVLGPGHRWPYALVPMYWLFERIPAT